MNRIRDIIPVELVDNGWTFLATTTKETPDYLVKMKKNREKQEPLKTFHIMPFHTAILKYNPTTNRCTHWQKEKGYSLWEKI